MDIFFSTNIMDSLGNKEEAQMMKFNGTFIIYAGFLACLLIMLILAIRWSKKDE
jgi:hypothetical protein